MSSVLLAVNPINVVLFCKGYQRGKGDLGGICLQGEHRLTKYGLANRDAIQAPN
jgi:hypothetical protein